MTGARPAGNAATRQILAVVRRVPRGKVVTYGQAARLAGLPGAARQVGYAMARLDAESTVPWHRVIRADGTIAPRSGRWSDGELRQLRRLEREGVVLGESGRIDLASCRWEP